MFVAPGRQLDSFDEKLLGAFFSLPQAKAQDLAQQIPSSKLHFRSLANAVLHVRRSYAYVLDALQRWDDLEWPMVEDTVARELSSGTMFLGGAMDGMIILEASLSGMQPTAAMSFERSIFNTPALKDIQDKAKALKSSAMPNQPLYADFWTLVNFWKHYFPYQPRPSLFVKSGDIRDIKVAIGSGCNSGPIFRDLLVPTFNLSCELLGKLAEMVHEPFDVKPLE
jgi:hypothetical protein